MTGRTSRRVSAPGLHLGGSLGLRWWELPLPESSEKPPPPSPRKNNDVRARVDCHWNKKKDEVSSSQEMWNTEYARLTAYLENAYGGEGGDGEGIEHPGHEMYEPSEKLTVAKVLEHYDHDAEVRKQAKRRAKRDAQKLAQELGSAHAPTDGGDERVDRRSAAQRREARAATDFYGGGTHHGGAALDELTAERQSQVIRLAKQLGHPFSSLRTSGSVTSWWPVHSHVQPAWGESKFQPRGEQPSHGRSPPWQTVKV